MATIAAALEVELPAKNAAEDSHNLLPLVEGMESGQPIREAHVHNTKPDHYAIRSGDWLLVDAENGYLSGRKKGWEAKHGYPADDGAPAELYNLRADPGQRENLANDHPEKIAELQTLLNEIRARGHSAPRLDQ